MRVLAEEEGRSILVLVKGYSSSEGSADINKEVSTRRAEAARRALISRGIPAALLNTEGTGALRIPESEGSEADRASNRSVTFSVEVL